MHAPPVDGFEAVVEPPHIYYVRDDWKDLLLDDLRDNFGKVEAGDRVMHPDGRVRHFSYKPDGAPGRVFVRRAVRAGIARFLGDLHLGMGRAVHELRVCSEAHRKGVHVPEIVAVRITRAAPFFYRFLFVAREISGARNLSRLASEAEPREKWKAIHELAEAMRQMHQAGVYHGDLTIRNILVSDGNGGPEVHFVDLDRARLMNGRAQKWDEANIERLNRSVVKRLPRSGPITLTDKYRFLLAYSGDRDKARRTARRIGRSLWFHRLWWAVTGQKAKAKKRRP